ncbi:unnamed protein product [Leuciscus chuanchicus]
MLEKRHAKREVTPSAVSAASNDQLLDCHASLTLPSNSETNLESLSENGSALKPANSEAEPEVSSCIDLLPPSSSKSKLTTPPLSPVPECSNPGPSQTVSDNTCTSAASTPVPCSQYPSDRANYPVDIADDEIKRCILRNGPCQPEGPFPRDVKNRCFSAEFYYRTSKKGSKIPRRWL